MDHRVRPFIHNLEFLESVIELKAKSLENRNKKGVRDPQRILMNSTDYKQSQGSMSGKGLLSTSTFRKTSQTRLGSDMGRTTTVFDYVDLHKKAEQK